MPEHLQAAIADAVVRVIRGESDYLLNPYGGVTRYRHQLRNEYLARAFSLVPGNSPCQRAENLAREVRRFAADIWPRWKHLQAPPEHASLLRQNLFHAFKVGGKVPERWRRIYDIANSHPELCSQTDSESWSHEPKENESDQLQIRNLHPGQPDRRK